MKRAGAASSLKKVYAALLSMRVRTYEMGRFTKPWNRFRRWPAQHRAQLRLCLRVTASAVLALALAHLLNLPLALWTVLTAVLLTQISVGRSLKATTDYLVSTLGGAIYAGAVGALVPHTDEIALLGALALAVGPAALVAATNPRFSAAPFTAVMVFFGPTITHTGPIASAAERVIEVAVGAVVGLVVSFVVLPARARELVIETAGRMLALMAQALPELCAGFTADMDATAIRRIQDPLGDALARLSTIAPEVRHEQMTRLADAPDPGPLLRTLLRLRHDLVMIGRAALVPLPESLRARLGAPIGRVAEIAAGYLRASSAALIAREGPPSLDGVEAALDGYATQLAAVRREGLTRELTSEAVERLFALGFTLEHMRQNFRDLARCVTEFARGSAA
jgi:uncharacterized membrane protein YccC